MAARRRDAGSQSLNLPVGELASVVFGCTHATYDECVTGLVFGLPERHYSYVKNITPGLPLFLFNYDSRMLHGIFEAGSSGDLNIRPSAWTGGKGGKTGYPAQVRVREICPCSPLPEKVFKEAIAANYQKGPKNHFYFELNQVQTDMLRSLFMKNPTYESLQTWPLGWTQPGHEEVLMAPQISFTDAWDNARPYAPALAPMFPALSEGRTKTLEKWDYGSDIVKDETSAGNAGAGPPDAVGRSLEPLAGKSLDGRAGVKLSNGKPCDIEEDCRQAEKLTQMMQKSKLQSNVEMRVELSLMQGKSQREFLDSSFIESTPIQDSAHIGSTGVQDSAFIESIRVPESSGVETTNAHDSSFVEWERLSRERCLQEQTFLREERELLIERFQALDGPVAKAIDKNLEICARVIAQMRQDQIKHIVDEAMNNVELLRELDQLRKKNVYLENTQVKMASELERLKSDVARISQQQLLPSLTSQMPPQSEAHMLNTVQVLETGSTQGNGNQEFFQQIYLIGGYDGESWLGSVDLFNPATYEIISIAPLLTARSYAAATVLKGSIYVFGGGNGRLWYETGIDHKRDIEYERGICYDAVETYNEERQEWILCPSMSLKRGNLAGATVGDRIFAIGGGNQDVYFSEVECYDGHGDRWINSTSMLNKRFDVAAAELNGALYAIGGYNDEEYLSSVERFDPREALWTAVAPMTRKRRGLSAITLGGGLYAIGGFDGKQFLNSMEFYESRTNRWAEMESRMQIGRAFASVARMGNDFYIFGGLNRAGCLDTVEYYSEPTGWEVVDDIALGPRCFLTSAMLEESTG